MQRLSLHSTLRLVWLAATLLLPFLPGGCALWEDERWDWNRYRDERAVDIDQRLERNEAIVKNPF